MIKPGLKGERMAALFLLGLLAFTPPILSIFSIHTFVFGIPILYVYLFIAWAVLILLMAIVIERRDEEGGERPPEEELEIPPPNNDGLGT